MISIQNLSSSYGKTKVLSQFNLSLEQGMSYALIGPSGCGKSTVLKILSGIHLEYEGNILYKEQVYSAKNIKIGYIPQSYGLLPWKTVKDNILLPSKLIKTNGVNPKDAEDIISTLEIQDLQNKYPLQLSGGQRQRVALARAFILQPDLLLMDEPFSSLDSFTSVRSQQLYLKLWKKYNITTLFVTHNIYEAMMVSQQILLMSKKSGNIIKQIANSVLDTQDETKRFELAGNIMDLFEQTIV